MKFLKGLALALLGLCLFLSLFVFGIALTLNQTVLNPDFAIAQVDRFDINLLAEELLREQIPPEGGEFMADVLNGTIADLEPCIKERESDIIHSIYDYLEGRSQNISLVISLEPVKESLRDNLRQAFLQSPPPELAGLPPAEIEQYFNQSYQQVAEEIPETFEFNETSLGADVVLVLDGIRQGTGYFHLGYKVLIGFILLLILLIILLKREVRGSTRELGTTFLSFGALSYISVLVIKHFAVIQLTQIDMPVYLQTWIPQLIKDILTPLEIYSLGLLIAGVILLVVSFVYKRRQTQDEPAGSPSTQLS